MAVNLIDHLTAWTFFFQVQKDGPACIDMNCYGKRLIVPIHEMRDWERKKIGLFQYTQLVLGKFNPTRYAVFLCQKKADHTQHVTKSYIDCFLIFFFHSIPEVKSYEGMWPPRNKKFNTQCSTKSHGQMKTKNRMCGLQ